MDKWTVATREEEHVIIQQFLRFGETKSIAQEIILQDTKDHQDMFLTKSSRSDSEIKKFIERSNHTMHSYMRGLDTRHLFTAGRLPFVPVSSRLMAPGSFSPPASRELRPPTVSSVSSASPITTSPLGRLQTMQPFDFRREQSSPTMSPSIPEKHPPGSSPCDSPKHMSSTPNSSSSLTPPFTPIKSRESREHTPLPGPLGTPTGLPTPMTLPILPPSDGSLQSEDAIDYSTGNKEFKKEFHPSMLYDDRKLKHLRKSHTPSKRTWTPSPGFGCTFIGPNGKKRVLCTACNKTFCDKGALKIHYSAVHLKEMHKCTVDGCNMMFSSRRSRNRHSANPNPKLHMPQKRLKLPEGATCIDDGSVQPNTVGNLDNSPPSMVLPPSLGQKALDMDSPDGLSHGGHAFYAELNAHLAMFPSAEKKMKLERAMGDDSPRDLSIVDRRDMMSESDDSDDECGKVDSPQLNRNRRKANVPTRCTTQSEESFMLSDDNSDEPNSDKDMLKHARMMAEYDGDEGEPLHEGMRPCSDSDDEDFTQDQKQHFLSNSNGMEIDQSRPDFPKITSLLNKNVARAMDFSMKRDTTAEDQSEQRSTNHVTDQESATSVDSSKMCESEDADVDNNQCSVCQKTFPNHNSLNQHYQNVHLKLMHKCRVDGCGAEFPSRRSRDRHSANITLHKKLLPTSDSEREEDNNENQKLKENGFSVLEGKNECNENRDPEENGNKSDMSDQEDDELGHEVAVDKEGCAVYCHVCHSKFKDNLALKEHFEVNHPKEIYHCTINGCEKIFSTRKSRNRHSQNDNLHRPVQTAKRNGIC